MATREYDLLPTEQAAYDLPDHHPKGATEEDLAAEILYRVGEAATVTWSIANGKMTVN